MKKTEIMTKVRGTFYKAGLQLKKYSPEILVMAGVAGTVVSTVMACKATLKINEVIDKTKNDINEIHDATEKGVTKSGKEYSDEDSKKDLAIIYIQTGAKLVKLYAPAVMLGGLSITSILASNNILRKRNVALGAAYAAVDKSFKDYRHRVAERFGEEVDKELKYSIKAKKFDETAVNPETGKEKKVKSTVNVSDMNECSDYARFFDESSLYWEKDAEYNLMFLRAEQNYANDRLRARGYLFLNEVYERLGIKTTKAGQCVGWVYNPENPNGDNYVDFGIYEINREKNRDFVNGYERSILLDFNVDGCILNLI